MTFSAATVSIVCRVGYSDVDPTFMPNAFSVVPKGTPTTVFAAYLSLPTAPPTPAPAPFVAAIQFTAPWVFVNAPGNGKSLMIDIESNGFGTPWPCDAHYLSGDGRPATSASLGAAGCNASHNLPINNGFLSGRSAMPGGMLLTQSVSWPSTVATALSMIGLNSAAPYPIDLVAIGAPGCMLRTDMVVGQVVPTKNVPPEVRASALWPVPADPSLAGAALNNQWAGIDPAANALGVVVSDALRITLGTAPSRPFATQYQFNSYAWLDSAMQYGGENGPIVEFHGLLH